MPAFLRFLVVITIAVVCCAAEVGAKWGVEIESKTVDAGDTAVTVDITAYWDIDMTGFTVPIIVREIDPGAFWTGTLPFDTGGNAYIHPYAQGVEWKWGLTWAEIIEEVRPASGVGIPCNPGIDTLYNGESPDHFVINAKGGAINAPAEPTGKVVVTLTFDVGTVVGQFEFDTACFSGSLPSIFMVDNGNPPINHGPSNDGYGVPGTDEATFNKGVITIQDITQNDTDGDGVADSVDNCPQIHNSGQENSDADDLGDACDNCPETDNPDQDDSDGDEIGTLCDNCPDDYNPLQEDSDSNGVGDSCQANAILEFEDAVPADYALLQNYPNPFNASTLIEFTVREGGYARLEVYDILGRNVATLVDGFVPAGHSQAVWNGTDARGNTLSSGIYFYRLTTSDFTGLKKMVLMK